jgi:membrane protein
MRMSAQVGILSLLVAAVKEWLRHKSPRLGAALAYYSVFALGPLLLIVTGVAGLVFDADMVRQQLSGQFRSLLGPTGAQAVDAMLKGAEGPRQSGWLATFAGIGLLLVAALGVVAQLKDAINTIWETSEPKHAGLWSYFQSYLVSLAGILALGFLLAVSLVFSTALAALSDRIGETETLLWQAANISGSLIILSALFALLFKYFPDSEVLWRDALAGGACTAVLFTIGKAAIAWYIGRQGIESTYGAAASIVVLLIWVYYSAQIVLFGAEVTHLLAKQRAPSAQREPTV